MNLTAQALGRLAAGVPKNFSKAERARRSAWMRTVNRRRRRRKLNPPPK